MAKLVVLDDEILTRPLAYRSAAGAGLVRGRPKRGGSPRATIAPSRVTGHHNDTVETC